MAIKVFSFNMPIKQTHDLYAKASSFLADFYQEKNPGNGRILQRRLNEVSESIRDTGTYEQTHEELCYGARVAWRNSNRCIGRLHWQQLTIWDHRALASPDQIHQATLEYLAWSENGGKIRPAISVFAPRNPVTGEEIRFWNSKLVRYAGYQDSDGVTGDPDEVEFTRACNALGWKGDGGRFDLLPMVIDVPGYPTAVYPWKHGFTPLQVPITHPFYDWFSAMGLRWYAVPVISDMVLEIGGIAYSAAPFNGWFMGTEIGSRNLGDQHRYNMLPEIASRMGLDMRKRETLWKDRAMTELNTAVLHSFNTHGVTMIDHHTASVQFRRFERREERAGREVCGDWGWLVPPASGSASPLFHRNWSNEVKSPNFYYNDPAWKAADTCPLTSSLPSTEQPLPRASCPFHIDSRFDRQVGKPPTTPSDPAG